MNWRIERAPKGEPHGFGIAITTQEIILMVWNRAYVVEFSA